MPMSLSASPVSDRDNVVDLAAARLRYRRRDGARTAPCTEAGRRAGQPLAGWYPIFYLFPIWPTGHEPDDMVGG
jgi:hypothetical protein